MAMEVSAPNTAVRVSWTCDRGMEPKLWSIGEENAKLNVAFLWCEMNSIFDFRGKKQGFNGKKPAKWDALPTNISRDLNKLVWCGEKWDAQANVLQIILKRLVQIASKFSEKYFCSKNFLPEPFLDRQNGRKNFENNGPSTSTSQSMTSLELPSESQVFSEGHWSGGG